MQIRVVQNQNSIYSKEKLLGEGAFGKAYLVKHKQSGENLVIKQMNIEHMSQKQKQQTFKQAQILKNLSHPNIVKFKEVYVTKNNKLKIVMQYAECGDLAKAIHSRKAKKQYFQQGQILDWFTQICLSIKHVHDRKIIHRDIKGQNIFITKSNSLKLGDFGIARVLNKTMEKARTVVGTPYYLSPQIIENKPYSFESDIWSIGAVLYEMCALQPPFIAPSLQMLALKIVKGSYSPIQGKYSQDLKSLISEMLTLTPSRRPTINQILKKPVLQDRIRKFLSQTKRISEFSHTILHNQRVQILANKLVKIQQQKKKTTSKQKNVVSDIDNQRQKLKEDQMRMQALMLKKKQQQRKKQQQKLLKQRRKKQQQRRQQQAHRRQKQKRRQEEQRKKWIERQKQKQQYQRDKQYEENRRMAQILKQRRDQEQKQYERQMQIQQLMMQKQQIQERARRELQDRKRKQKMRVQDKKAQDFQDAARKQYFENLQIRRRAQQRAKRQQQTYYSEPVTPQQPPVENYHYQNNRPSSKNNQRASSRQRRNRSDIHNRQPSQQQIQNAYLNPNFNKKRASIDKKSSRPSSQQQNRPSKNQHEQISNNESRRKIEEARQKMRKDRQNFIRNKSKGNITEQTPLQDTSQIENIKDKTRIGKWGKKNSRNNSSQEKSPRFPTEQQTKQDQKSNSPKRGFDTLIKQSQQLFLQPQNPAQFNNYVEQLQDILNDVQKKIDLLPQIPCHDEIVFREDDELQLEFSLTANNPKIKKDQDEEIDTEDVDLEYFSNFSKLQTLRMQLQQAFGLENFIRLYRYLETQINKNGLQNFNIVEAVEEAGGDIDSKVLKKNLTFLLTLVTMEDKINSV